MNATFRTGSIVILAVGLVSTHGCIANPKPDIPQVEQPIDVERVRVDNGSGSNRVLIAGLDGAADERGHAVRVQNLLSGDGQRVSVAVDGSFSVEVTATPTQVFELTLELGDGALAAPVYVAGNAERNAVDVSNGGFCETLPNPTAEECLVCTVAGETTIAGCDLSDFTQEAPLNAANVAECLFLSEGAVVMEFDGFYYYYDDYYYDDPLDIRFDEVDIFNGCGETLLIDVRTVESEHRARFDFLPNEDSAPLTVEPTFFGAVEIFYDARNRAADDPADSATVVIDAFIPGETRRDDVLLGTMQLEVTAP